MKSDSVERKMWCIFSTTDEREDNHVSTAPLAIYYLPFGRRHTNTNANTSQDMISSSI